MIANFYNNLLSIEITILGIITAGIFVFIQILHSNFSYKDLVLSLRRITLLTYFVLSTLLIVITGLGALHFAMSPHDLFPRWNLETVTIFESDITLLIIFIGLLSSASLGMYIIFESIKLLNPSTLLRRHLENIQSDDVKKFLYNRYGVPEPFQPISIFYTLQGVEETQEEKDKKDAEIKEKQEKFEEENRVADQLKKESQNATEVFEGFETLLVRAISQGDRSTVKKGLADYELKIKEIIADVDKSFPIHHLATYISENLSITLEACRKHDALSLSPQLIKTSGNIMDTFARKFQQESDEILKEWKAQADVAIESSDRLTFREIIKNYQNTADIIFEQDELPLNNSLDTVFRHLGWLAERLLAKKGIEEKPLMYDDDYEDEFGAIYNALFHFEHKYNHDNPSAYPLIFFDAIHVLFDSLLEVYKKSEEERIQAINKRGDIKDWLFSCAYVYSSFASQAIKVSNGDGFALAGTRLRQLYRTAEINNEEELARNILELIVQLAILGAMNPDNLVGDSYGAGKAVEDSEEIITNSSYRDTIRSAVFDNYLRLNEGDYEKKIAYIRSLGEKLGTDFGLNLSSETE